MKEKGNFHTALFKIQSFSKTCKNNKFHSKNIPNKSWFFFVTVIVRVIDLKEAREFI